MHHTMPDRDPKGQIIGIPAQDHCVEEQRNLLLSEQDNNTIATHMIMKNDLKGFMAHLL